jgi:maltooligosyltrehalose trehalohydrolase
METTARGGRENREGRVDVPTALGALVTDTGVRFRTWAPAQKSVAVAIDGGREIAMTADAQGYFAVTVADARPGQRYWFKLREGLRPDPASRFQPDGPLGPSEIVDPRSYQWAMNDWRGAPPLHQNVFYEMHLGTFTKAGTWRAAERHLAALAEIGVTTIEVMPIAEFPGRFGWGYDGVNLFAPTRLYGTPDDAKHFIDTAHALGLAVVLDVVYNHFGPVGNYLRDFTTTIFGKPGDWGDSINYDGEGSAPVRAMMIENVAYWIGEFRFDGLRFDATHGIHDTSEEHIVSEMCAAARRAAGARNVVLVGESEPQDTRLLRIGGAYRDGLDALWNEDWHHAAFVALTGRRQAYFTDYYGTAAEFASLARHNTLYQGQWYSWQNNSRGGFAMGLPSSAFVSFLENHDQVANTGLGGRLYQDGDPGKWRVFTTLLLAGPQLPLLFQGVEHASLAPFVYFADHEGELGEAVRKGRLQFLEQFPSLATKEMQSLIKDPGDEAGFRACTLDHDARGPLHDHARALHADLLRLRRTDPVFSRLGSLDVAVESSTPAAAVLLIRYRSSWGERLIVANLGVDELSRMDDALFAPLPGHKWQMKWSSEAPQYGGSGSTPLAADGRWLLMGSSAAILELVETAFEAG